MTKLSIRQHGLATHRSGQSMSRGYRAEIEGLRAVAVMAVILNHVDARLLPSGFLGVDVFFVISGFVITSAIQSIQSASFGDFLATFFERRIKRLLPALVLCVAVTGILITYFDPHPKIALTTGVFSLFGFSNIYLFGISNDYFARASEANPYTQTWSLGVEEQYYLVFPIVVWLTGFSRLSAGLGRLQFLMTVLTSLSLVAYLFTHSENPSAAFYLMPTRFWELGAGCLLCLFLMNRGRHYLHGVSRVLQLSAPALLIATLAAPKDAVPWSSVLVVVLTLLTIGTASPGTIVHSLLSSAVPRYVGRISYSLYLWHWSVLCISRWYLGNHLSLVPILLVGMLLLSSLSYSYVEQPLRFALWSKNKGWSISLGLCGSVVVSLFLVMVYGQSGAIHRVQKNELEAAAPFFPVYETGRPHNPTCVVDKSGQRPLAHDAFDVCTVAPAVSKGQSIWALGDSHAGHLQGLLHQVHRNLGLGVHLIETPGISFPFDGDAFEPRIAIFSEIMRRAERDDIILVSRLFFDIDGAVDTPRVTLDNWVGALRDLAGELEKKGLKLVVIGPPPIFHYNDTSSCGYSVLGLNPCVVERSSASNLSDRVLERLENGLGGQHNAYVFNAFNVLCPSSKNVCSPIDGQRLLFRDNTHLNVFGATALTVPFVEFLQEKRLLVSTEKVLGGEHALFDMKSKELNWMSTINVSGPEPWGRWTDGSPVAFKFASWLPKNFRVRFGLNGAFGPVAGSRIEVLIGEQVQTFVAPAGAALIELRFNDVPKATDLLVIKVPDPVSPMELNLSADKRKLGLGLVSVEIIPEV